MKSICTIVSTALLFLSLSAAAQTTGPNVSRSTLERTYGVNNQDKTDQVGVGLQLGSFSGVSLDYWYTAANSWNFGVLGAYDNVGVTLAHQWYFPGTFPGDANVLVPYIGAGVLGVFGNHEDYLPNRTDSFALAAQLPLGIELLPTRQRFGVFAELKPSLEVTPVAFGFLNADFGGRFYF